MLVAISRGEKERQRREGNREHDWEREFWRKETPKGIAAAEMNVLYVFGRLGIREEEAPFCGAAGSS